jgi:hypothetical protein
LIQRPSTIVPLTTAPITCRRRHHPSPALRARPAAVAVLRQTTPPARLLPECAIPRPLPAPNVRPR